MNTPTQAYRRLDVRPPPKLLKGIDANLNSLVGVYRRRGGVRSRLRDQARQIDALAATYQPLADHELHDRLMEFRAGFRRGGRGCESMLLPALAAIREAADRKLGLRPFEVQLMGALALHRGFLAEMATGEGKTLTAGLAAILAGWTRRPCHIVTVNDYLVERDADWIRPLYSFCGIRAGSVTGAMAQPERRKGYDADVTYVTSKELLADFLRDRLRLGPLTNPSRRLIRHLHQPRRSLGDAELALRGLHTAIVDEADSVLIDEAVTPLIISAPHQDALLEGAVGAARQIAQALAPGQDYRLNLRYREIELLPAGRARLEALCDELSGIWRARERREELVRQALVAREFFLRDRQYIVTDGKVVIVDEFTGRQMPQRSWRQGLHQAIEAKEGLAFSNASKTIARLSFQRFFRCFSQLAGMTGTAREAAGEFWQIYKLPVITIPTHERCARQHWPDRLFSDPDGKWRAIVGEVQRLHASGRPVLIGTRSVEASEKLAALLTAAGLDVKVLNAVRHKDEAGLVAQAGAHGRITIATNMAGRGTDIKLTPEVLKLGGLHVLATERHESNRVDRQLFGRAGRQGDPGSCQAFVSMGDELLSRHLPPGAQHVVRQAAHHGVSGWRKLGRAAFTLAQKRAQSQAFKQRQSVLVADTWLDESLSFAGLEVA